MEAEARAKHESRVRVADDQIPSHSGRGSRWHLSGCHCGRWRGTNAQFVAGRSFERRSQVVKVDGNE